MNEDIKKILRTIKYCAGDYMKQEEGVQCFEWSDLWVLNEYIEKLQNNWNELKKCTKETIEEFEKNRYILSVFDKGAFATTKVIYHKMQELEQGKDENN